MGRTHKSGRKRMFSAKKFRRIYEQSKTVMEISTSLGISLPTVYKYIRELNLPALGSDTSLDTALEIFNSYKGLLTLTDLEYMHNVSRTTLRSRLEFAIRKLWSKQNPDRPQLPMPQRLTHIKIYNELKDNPEIPDEFHREEWLHEVTRVPIITIHNYLKGEKL